MSFWSTAWAADGAARTYLDWTIFNAIHDHPGLAAIVILLIALVVAILFYRFVHRMRREVEDIVESGRRNVHSIQDYLRRRSNRRRFPPGESPGGRTSNTG